FHPIRPPVVVPPKPPVATPARLPTVTGTETHALELADISGKHHFKVTLTGSTAVDTRGYDYLAKSLRIGAVTPADRTDFPDWQKHAGPGRPGADIAVTLASTDGANAADFTALPPDGVELIRPGVLRVRDELVAGLAQRREFRFSDALRGRPLEPLRH